MTGQAELAFPTKRLKHVVLLRRSHIEGIEDDRPYVGLENIASWTGKLQGDYSASQIGGSAPSSNTFQPGDVLFGKLRPYLAKVWVAEFAGRSTTECLVMQPVEVEQRFLKYLCLNRDFIDAVNASTFGSKMPRADWQIVGNVSVPAPNAPRQHAIADYLDRETARLEALIGEKQRVLGLLGERRRALVTRAVSRGLAPNVPLRDSGISWLGEIPAHWEVVALRFLVDLTSGSTPDTGKPEYWNGEIPWVTPKDMKQNEITNSRDHVSELALSKCLLRLIEPGAVLIVVRGMILAHSLPVAANTKPVTINQDMKALRCCPRLRSHYVRDFFRGFERHIVSLADSSAHGTRKLDSEVLGRMKVPLPPVSEQQEIVTYITKATSKLNALQSAVERSIVLLKERRTALIAAAVTGQIEVEGAT